MTDQSSIYCDIAIDLCIMIYFETVDLFLTSTYGTFVTFKMKKLCTKFILYAIFSSSLKSQTGESNRQRDRKQISTFFLYMMLYFSIRATNTNQVA